MSIHTKRSQCRGT